MANPKPITPHNKPKFLLFFLPLQLYFPSLLSNNQNSSVFFLIYITDPFHTSTSTSYQSSMLSSIPCKPALNMDFHLFPDLLLHI